MSDAVRIEGAKTAMQIAEHAPGKLYSRNRGLLKLSKNQLHDFATGSEKGKPERKGKLYGNGK